MNTEKDTFEYNNEEEAEMAQLQSIHNNMNAIADVRRVLEAQAAKPSLEDCEDCGESIPIQRQKFVRGCTRCIYCQELYERRLKGY